MDGYRVLRAGDVRQDAISLELYDDNDRLLMDVYEVGDDPSSRVLRVFDRVDVPVSVIDWFLAEAQQRLRIVR